MLGHQSLAFAYVFGLLEPFQWQVVVDVLLETPHYIHVDLLVLEDVLQNFGIVGLSLLQFALLYQNWLGRNWLNNDALFKLAFLLPLVLRCVLVGLLVFSFFLDRLGRQISRSGCHFLFRASSV